MKNIIISLLAAPFILMGTTACNEIVEQGTVPFEQWKADKERGYAYTVYSLEHPCVIHTQSDIDYVKQHISQEPWASAFNYLKNSQYANTGWNANPVEYLARLDATNWGSNNTRWEAAGISHLWYEGIHNNYTNFMRDAAAAYQQALLFQLENNTQAAENSIKIMKAWADKNKGFIRNAKTGELVDPNEKLILFQPYQMAAAAEMLRDYNNWSGTDDFKKVVNWLHDTFYPVAHEQLNMHLTDPNHTWLNWDLAALTTMLSIGVLTENQDEINEAIMYFKGDGLGPGNITKGCVEVFDDPDSDEVIGQCNELGRDQGHNALCAVLTGIFCKMGLALGDDLFAYNDYRALVMAEYTAKYNLPTAAVMANLDKSSTNRSFDVSSGDNAFQYKHETFPFTTFTYSGQTMTEPSKDGRGNLRPGWDYFVGYANTHGVANKIAYISAMGEGIRPDNGCGYYGTASGGFDQIGWGTLMGYKE